MPIARSINRTVARKSSTGLFTFVWGAWSFVWGD